MCMSTRLNGCETCIIEILKGEDNIFLAQNRKWGGESIELPNKLCDFLSTRVSLYSHTIFFLHTIYKGWWVTN